MSPDERAPSQLWSILVVALPIAALCGALALPRALAERATRRAWAIEHPGEWDPLDGSLIDQVLSGGTKQGYLFVVEGSP